MLRNSILYQSVLLTFGLAFGLTAHSASASTTVDYVSPCEYYVADRLQVAQTCSINFGILGTAGGVRYIVTFPNGAKIWVYDPVEGEATTNDILSIVTTDENGFVTVRTVENEVFVFKSWRR